MMIIWLQGIWLPLHGYSFERTPLWAGIYLLPLTVGFLVAGPLSGWLSDRYGARPFATGGMVIAGLASSLPHTLQSGLASNGVPADVASRVANLPPVGSLFAAFLGYNPVQTLLGPQVLGSLPPGRAAFLTGHSYFPQLISGPFAHGLRVVFTAAALLCLVAAVASRS